MEGDQCPGCGAMRGCECTPADIRAQLVKDRAELSDRAAGLTQRSLRLAALEDAARAWDKLWVWSDTLVFDGYDEEKALHEAVLRLDERGTGDDRG